MLCKHKERIEDKATFPSAWQQMTEAERARLIEVCGEKLLDPAVTEQLYKGKVIITFLCTECGKHRTVVKKGP